MVATFVFLFLKNLKAVSLNRADDVSEDVLRPYFFIVFASLWACISVQTQAKGPKGVKTDPFLGTSFTWYRVLSITMTFLITFELVKYSWDLPFWIAAVFLIKDYVWFMINPNFGVSKFNKVDIPWHTWVFRLPLIHWICGLIMVFTAIGKQATINNTSDDGNHTVIEHKHDIHHEHHENHIHFEYHEHHEQGTILWLYTSIVFSYLILTSVVSRVLEPQEIIEVIKPQAPKTTFKNKMNYKAKEKIYF